MRFRGTLGAMWKPILGYGVLLALGTLALQWLDYQRFARSHAVVRDGSPVRAPRTWLASVGWRRRGRVRLDERPRAPA